MIENVVQEKLGKKQVAKSQVLPQAVSRVPVTGRGVHIYWGLLTSVIKEMYRF